MSEEPTQTDIRAIYDALYQASSMTEHCHIGYLVNSTFIPIAPLPLHRRVHEWLRRRLRPEEYEDE